MESRVNRFDDPPLLTEDDPTAAERERLVYQAAVDQAHVVVTFLRELEACGVPHAEALWLTAQFWRSQ
jgi:hypothetical protein